MSHSAFRHWCGRQQKHQQAVKAATGLNDLSQCSKEVERLEKHANTLRKARKFRRNEEEARIVTANTVLVGKLCDVAHRSEERQRSVATSPPRMGPATLHKPFQRKIAHEIDQENLKIMRRLQASRPVVASTAQLEDVYRNVHAAARGRMTRFKRRGADPLKPLTQSPRAMRDPDWDWRPGAQRWPPRLPPMSQHPSNVDGPLPNGWQEPSSPFGASPPWSPGQQELDYDSDTPEPSQLQREASSGSASCSSPVVDQQAGQTSQQGHEAAMRVLSEEVRPYLTCLYEKVG